MMSGTRQKKMTARMMIKLFTAADIESVHSIIAEDSPVPIPQGCREGVLEMIAVAADRSVFGVNIYKTVYQRAAALMQEIIRLHPFRDGNKRTGLLAACVLMSLKGIHMNLPTNASRMARRVAADPETDHVPYLAQWFDTHQLWSEILIAEREHEIRELKKRYNDG